MISRVFTKKNRVTVTSTRFHHNNMYIVRQRIQNMSVKIISTSCREIQNAVNKVLHGFAFKI